MSTLVIRQPVSRQSLTPPPQDAATRAGPIRSRAAPIPNKHIPYCSPGPVPAARSQTSPLTPPDSPPDKSSLFPSTPPLQNVERYPQISGVPPIYSVGAAELALAVNHQSTQLLPDPKHVFPWLHGLSAENQVQLAFFSARRRLQRSTPRCFRGVVIVKVGGDLSRARLKSAIAADEILEDGRHSDADAHFLDIDPKEGFSIRNFQIQCTKMAVMSDIVLYRDETATDHDVQHLARKVSIAQDSWRISSRGHESDASPRYNTFVLRDSFATIASQHPELIAVDTDGNPGQDVADFSLWERQEMCAMSKASEISRNVWLGPTPGTDLDLATRRTSEEGFDIVIEATDTAGLPSPYTLKRIGQMSLKTPQHLEFPASGSLLAESHAHPKADPLIRMCQWMHGLANPTSPTSPSDEVDRDEDGDIRMKSLPSRPRRFLIHCTDGYTETTMLALAYFMYAEEIPLHTALTRLHCEKNRNFFAYPSDIPVLAAIQPHILERSASSPSRKGSHRPSSIKSCGEPAWLSKIDGSLPSRILPHMYLGNLAHANNPELLRAMGIGQVLSVGEPVSWPRGQLEAWGKGNVLAINDVQDNGVDSLMKEFDRCLNFIARGAHRPNPTATLVHCRVGVSRSATICIAAIMSTLHLSFPRAYCYVRARRLNVIIQPHLRFAYELMKWDEICQTRRGEPVRRDVDWASVAREIGRLNAPYCSR